MVLQIPAGVKGDRWHQYQVQLLGRAWQQLKGGTTIYKITRQPLSANRYPQLAVLTLTILFVACSEAMGF